LAVRKLLFSNTFDFTDKGPFLLERLIQELRASIDSYEVSTGQQVESFFIGGLPPALNWISQTLSNVLGLALVQINYRDWLSRIGLSITEDFDLGKFQNEHFALASMMSAGQYLKKKGALG